MTTATAAPALRVVRGQTTVEVYGAARLSLTPTEAANLVDELRQAIGRRRRIEWVVVVFRMGVRFGQTLARVKRARGAR